MRDGFDAVCFDIGGVLAQIHHTWEEAAHAAGVRLMQDRRLGGHSGFPLFEDYQAGRCGAELYFERLAEYLGVTQEEAARVHMGILEGPCPGTDELVARVESSGRLTGFLSNTNPEHWHEFVEGPRFPQIQRLKVKVGSQQVGINKPDPGIYELWSKRAGVWPTRILFFDDTLANVETALRLGWQAVWVDHSQPVAPQIDSTLRDRGL